MKILLLTGYAGSGKTTVGKILHAHLPFSNITAFADKVKDYVSNKYAIDRYLCDTQEGKRSIIDAGKTLRQLLIEYSADHKIETQDPAIWARYVHEAMKCSPHIQNWIIHDWRYKEEYEYFRTEGIPITTIRIVHPSIVPLADESEHQLYYKLGMELPVCMA